ncbi:myosin-3-like [Rhopilema esculentum]|uniref:myosin-3-like n=1 Tax=Rhopilema esculentum TaxID=499914 RepID=UPI0031D100C5
MDQKRAALGSNEIAVTFDDDSIGFGSKRECERMMSTKEDIAVCSNEIESSNIGSAVKGREKSQQGSLLIEVENIATLSEFEEFKIYCIKAKEKLKNHDAMEQSCKDMQDELNRLKLCVKEADKQRLKQERVMIENKVLAAKNEELSQKVDFLSKQLEKEVSSRANDKGYIFSLEIECETVREELEKQNEDRMKSLKLIESKKVQEANDILAKIEPNSLKEKLLQANLICEDTKINLELVAKKANEWSEVEDLVRSKSSECRPLTEDLRQNGIGSDQCSSEVGSQAVNVKDFIGILLKEQERAKKIIAEQNIQYNELKTRHDAVLAKNNELQNDISRLVLTERENSDLRKRLQKLSSERGIVRKNLDWQVEKESEIELLSETNSTLMTENERLRSHADQLVQEKSECEVVLGLLEKENEGLLEKAIKLDDLELHQNRRQDDVKGLQEEILFLGEIIREKDAEKMRLAEDVLDLQEKLENEEFKYLEAHEENECLKSEISDYKIRFDQLKSDYKMNQEVAIEQRGTISSLNLRKADLAIEIDHLKSHLGSLRKIKDENEALYSEVRSTKKDLKEMESQYHRAKFEVDRFKKKNEEMFADFNSAAEVFSMEKKQLLQKCISLEKFMAKERLEYEASLNETEREKEVLKSELGMIDGCHKFNLEAMVKLRDELAECKKNLAVYEVNDNRPRDDPRWKLAENNKYEAKLKNCFCQITQLEYEIERRGKVIKENEEDFKKFATKYKEIKAERDELRNEYFQSKVSVQKLESQQHLIVRKSRSLESQVVELEKKNDRLLAEKKEIEKLYFQCLKDNDKFCQSIHTLDMTLKLSKSRNENLGASKQAAQKEPEPTATEYTGAEAKCDESCEDNLQKTGSCYKTEPFGRSLFDNNL